MVRFSKMDLRGGKLVETSVREIDQQTILKCPHAILVQEHYREDGTCRCDDPSHTEMREWGYRWKGGRWR